MPNLSVLLDPDDPVVAAATSSDERARASLTRALGWASLAGSAAAEDPVADLLIERVLDHEGPFTAAAERGSPEGMSPGLLAAAADDLRSLQRVVEAVAHPREGRGPAQGPRAALKRSLAGRADWGKGVSELAAYLHRYGGGPLGRARVFRWEGALVPVPSPDPVTVEDLVGYEAERGPLLANLAKFVNGMPANNALLFGDRGAGKSVTVKALAARFPMEHLRLVEVARDRLAEFPHITSSLRDRPARFLLFVDDLSFEEGEVHYAALKTLLEGGVEAQPPNVLLYATSNRRHLVRETKGDRRQPNLGDDAAEIHVSDSFQEKLSLSDRFGLRVLFVAPDQETYLHICRELARRRGVDVAPERLDAEALMWCRRHNARSCRTARQFVDDLAGR